MVLASSLCNSFICCRRKVKKEDLEEPYGVINESGDSPPAKRLPHVSFRLPPNPPTNPQPSTSGIRDRAEDQDRDQDRDTNQNPNQSQRSSMAPSSQSHCSTRRALPKLPDVDSEPSNGAYSSIQVVGPKGSKGPKPSSTSPSPPAPSSSPLSPPKCHPSAYIEEGINPTYESIDAESDSASDHLYSKLESRNARRYDYPIFNGGVPAKSGASGTSATNPDEALYQSASQIYTATSEDPYSSIASQAMGDTSADIGYAQMKLDPPHRDQDHANTAAATRPLDKASRGQPSTSKDVEELYTKIRRTTPATPATKSPATIVAGDGPSTLPPTTSSFDAGTDSQLGDYLSTGSDKTSREPSYRYITVRESVDVIRRRLNEQQEALERNGDTRTRRNTMDSADGSSGSAIREHYYSSIGGGSDHYESVSVAALYERIPDLSIGNVRNEEQISTIEAAITSLARNIASHNPKNQLPSSSSAASSYPPPPFTTHHPSSGMARSAIGIGIAAGNGIPAGNDDEALNGTVPPKPPTSPIPNRFGGGGDTVDDYSSCPPSSSVDVNSFRHSLDPNLIPFIENSGPMYASIHHHHNPDKPSPGPRGETGTRTGDDARNDGMPSGSVSETGPSRPTASRNSPLNPLRSESEFCGSLLRDKRLRSGFHGFSGSPLASGMSFSQPLPGVEPSTAVSGAALNTGSLRTAKIGHNNGRGDNSRDSRSLEPLEGSIGPGPVDRRHGSGKPEESSKMDSIRRRLFHSAHTDAHGNSGIKHTAEGLGHPKSQRSAGSQNVPRNMSASYTVPSAPYRSVNRSPSGPLDLTSSSDADLAGQSNKRIPFVSRDRSYYDNLIGYKSSEAMVQSLPAPSSVQQNHQFGGDGDGGAERSSSQKSNEATMEQPKLADVVAAATTVAPAPPAAATSVAAVPSQQIYRSELEAYLAGPPLLSSTTRSVPIQIGAKSTDTSGFESTIMSRSFDSPASQINDISADENSNSTSAVLAVNRSKTFVSSSMVPPNSEAIFQPFSPDESR